MKVVVVTHNYIRRQGDLTALYLHRLSSGLVQRGLEITVICPHAPGLLSQDTIDGVRIIRFGYPFSRIKPIVYTGSMHEIVARSFLAKVVFVLFLLSFYRATVRICRQIRPDIIWANWWIPPGLVGAQAARRFRLPLIISSHGTDIALLDKGGVLRHLSRYVYRRVTKASVVSSFLKAKLLMKTAVMTDSDVLVIPMPVGMENFPKTPPPDNQVPILLSVARFTKQKRLSDVIEAAAKVASGGTALKILIVGEGPLEKELQDLVAQKGMSGKIEFMPLVAQQKLGALYRQCDAVILVSENEGFGLVLVEAGLTGRPVIASRSGGMTDIIENDVNGLLVDPGDINGLAKAMDMILRDKELRVRLGEAGHFRAMNEFATQVLVDKIRNLFLSTVTYPEPN